MKNHQFFFFFLKNTKPHDLIYSNHFVFNVLSHFDQFKISYYLVIFIYKHILNSIFK